jgi:hypothetical protein
MSSNSVNIAVRFVTPRCGWLMNACSADPKIGYYRLGILVASPSHPRETLGQHRTLINDLLLSLFFHSSFTNKPPFPYYVHSLSFTVKGKVHPGPCPESPEGEVEVELYPLTSTLDGVGGQGHTPAALLPRKNRDPFHRKLGGPQGRSGQTGKISPSPGFDLRTVQSVASRYTD